jgi:transposase
MAGRAEPTYAVLVEAARQSPMNVMDETGWKVGGRLRWLHVAVSAQVTVYAVLPGRGYEQSAVILGTEYDEFLVHDGWAPYYRFPFAFHQSCLSHLLRRCREMAWIASATAAAFPPRVKGLLQTSLELRDRYEQGELSEHGLRTTTGKLEAKLGRMVEQSYRNPSNQRLARHLAHEQPWLFTFLHCPGLDATKPLSEQALRGMVIARKVWGESELARSTHAPGPRMARMFRFSWKWRKRSHTKLMERTP